MSTPIPKSHQKAYFIILKKSEKETHNLQARFRNVKTRNSTLPKQFILPIEFFSKTNLQTSNVKLKKPQEISKLQRKFQFKGITLHYITLQGTKMVQGE